MSQNSRIVFGALIAAATLGAMQMAAGEAVSGPTLAERFQALSSQDGTADIDRLGKGDREAGLSRAGLASRTVQLRVEGLSNTSVLMRIPTEADKPTGNFAPASPAGKPADAEPRKVVACEPVVSVLTEVAKLLQPGRCVT